MRSCHDSGWIYFKIIFFDYVSHAFKSHFYFKLWPWNIHFHVLLKREERVREHAWAMFWSALLLQQNTVNDTKVLISSERMTRFDQQRRHMSLWWICLLKCVIKSSIRNSHCPQGNHLRSDHAFNYIDVPAEARSPAINMISYYQINAAFQTRCKAASAHSMLTSLR